MSKKSVKNIEALSPMEQEIYSKLYSKRIVRTDDVKEIVGGDHKSSDYISNLRKKGYFNKIHKGLYAIVPPNLIGQEDFSPDKILVASKVTGEYFISHHSALEIHGLANTVHNKVWITVRKPHRSFSYKGIDYESVTTKYFFGFEKVDYLGTYVKVSDRERTLLDCLRKSGYAGGWEELIKSLNNLAHIDGAKLLKYLQRYDEKYLYQKTGFIIDMLDLNVNEELMVVLKDRMSERTYYLDKSKDSYYLSKWNLMVPKKFKRSCSVGN